MALQDLLTLGEQNDTKKQGISPQRIDEILPYLRNLISYFREYPDMFVDFIKGEDSTFKFYFYQRIFLRIVMRHRYVFATFPRAYSKSFLSMMALMLRAIFYPNSELFITTGGKQQAASITIAKITEICRLIPALQNEINWDRGVSTKSKDSVEYVFKNGSKINILAARESSRGQRRTGGLMEECILIEGKTLNEIIIPTTNVDRLLPDGTRHPQEVVNKSQIYITTAGWKNSFAYDKLIQLLIQSVLNPDQVMIMGGTFETPIVEGLLNKDFVQNLQLNGTYNQDSFDREYRSIWSGDAENAFFSSEGFDKYRVLLQPEYEYSGHTSKNGYYIIGVDVGRYKCTTEATIIKVTPQVQGSALKSIVNIFTYDAQDFEAQAINIKRLYYKYKARTVAIDANGVGAGFIDFMIKAQIDPETNEQFIPFGVCGGTSAQAIDPYRKIKGDNVENEAMYLIKANASINTECYSYAKTQISSGKVKFLIDQQQAKIKLMDTKVGQNMSADKRNESLMPFVQTSILKAQMLNLVEENEGVNIILKQNSKSIKKDKFSSFIYGLYYIKQEEDRKNKRRSRDFSKLQFFN